MIRMQYRDPINVAFLTVITFGIYGLRWLAETRNEFNETLNSKVIPTLWWFLVPFGAYWWVWHYSEAAEKATEGKIKRNDTFLLFILVTLAPGSLFQFDISGDNLSKGVLAIIVLVGILVNLAVFSIFPYVIQTKINSLSELE